MAERRTWLWVIVGIAAIAAVAFITFVSLVAITVTRNAKVTTVARAEASSQFDLVRARFKGEKPLLTMSGDSVDDSELQRRSATSGPRPAQVLHVLAFDPDDQKLLRLSLPIWMLRFSSHGNLRIGSAGGLTLERVRLDPAAIERIGPAVLLDAQLEGADVLLWTE